MENVFLMASFGLGNETFDEAERKRKLKRFEALYHHFFHAAATRGDENGGVEERVECGGKISGDEIEDDLDLSSSCGDNGELFQDNLSQPKYSKTSPKSKK